MVESLTDDYVFEAVDEDDYFTIDYEEKLELI